MSESYKVLIMDPVSKVNGITLDSLLQISDQIADWCGRNLEKRAWCFYAGDFTKVEYNSVDVYVYSAYATFTNAEDALAFKLVWGYN